MVSWPRRWVAQAVAVYRQPRLLAVLLLGFSSGLPYALVSSTLSGWLSEEGVTRTSIGLFRLLLLAYTLKFLWAPLVDQLSLPWLGRLLGRRRSWGLLAQLALAASLLGLASSRPGVEPWVTALWALLVGFCSATQDIVIDAWRVELLEQRQQGAGAAVAVFGYRLAMLASGAGALWLAARFGWHASYFAMVLLSTVGMVTFLLSPEPAGLEQRPGAGREQPFLRRAVVEPLRDLLTRPSWPLILLLVVLYKLGVELVGVMAMPFYLELGFDKVTIAEYGKLLGFGATIAGGLLGGSLIYRLGVMRGLLACGVAQLVTILPFALLAAAGPLRWLLAAAIALESMGSGMVASALVAYLSALCRRAHTATQYALLSSLMALAGTLLGSGAGWLADRLGWTLFFLVCAACVLPALAVLGLLLRRSPAGAAAPGDAL